MSYSPNLNLGFLMEDPPPDPAAIRNTCPDGGTCHHSCPDGSLRNCFRVSSCAPLSGVYVNDRWPDTPKET